MSILIYAEHDNTELKAETAKLVHAASQIGGDIDVLVAGHDCAAVALESLWLMQVATNIN